MADAGVEVGDMVDGYVGVVGGNFYFWGYDVEDSSFENLPMHGELEEVQNRGVHVYIIITTVW